VAIAKAQGADIIGIVSRAQHADYVHSLGAAETMTAQDIAAGALASESIDGLLDSVAGTAFGSYVMRCVPAACCRSWAPSAAAMSRSMPSAWLK